MYDIHDVVNLTVKSPFYREEDEAISIENYEVTDLTEQKIDI